MNIGFAGVSVALSENWLIASTIEHLCIVAIPSAANRVFPGTQGLSNQCGYLGVKSGT